MYVTIIMILGVLASALYIAGQIKGTKDALAEFRTTEEDEGEDTLSQAYIAYLIVAVIVSMLLIGLMGVASFWIYVPPFFAIGSAAVVGWAFFIERTLERRP
jgi:hypothetical protein